MYIVLRNFARMGPRVLRLRLGHEGGLAAGCLTCTWSDESVDAIVQVLLLARDANAPVSAEHTQLQAPPKPQFAQHGGFQQTDQFLVGPVEFRVVDTTSSIRTQSENGAYLPYPVEELARVRTDHGFHHVGSVFHESGQPLPSRDLDGGSFDCADGRISESAGVQCLPDGRAYPVKFTDPCRVEVIQSGQVDRCQQPMFDKRIRLFHDGEKIAIETTMLDLEPEPVANQRLEIFNVLGDDQNVVREKKVIRRSHEGGWRVDQGISHGLVRGERRRGSVRKRQVPDAVGPIRQEREQVLDRANDVGPQAINPLPLGKVNVHVTLRRDAGTRYGVCFTTPPSSEIKSSRVRVRFPRFRRGPSHRTPARVVNVGAQASHRPPSGKVRETEPDLLKLSVRVVQLLVGQQNTLGAVFGRGEAGTAKREGGPSQESVQQNRVAAIGCLSEDSANGRILLQIGLQQTRSIAESPVQPQR